MSVRQALAHPWLQVLKQPGIEISEQYQISTERLRNYYVGLKYRITFVKKKAGITGILSLGSGLPMPRATTCSADVRLLGLSLTPHAWFTHQ